MSVTHYSIFVIISFEFDCRNNLDTKFENLLPRHKLVITFLISMNIDPWYNKKILQFLIKILNVRYELNNALWKVK